MNPVALIPAGEARVELRSKNSRFIGSAGPAPSVEAARAFLARLRAEFPDASHHVYAFAVGVGASVTHGMSDDGEPSGTAGRPVLAVVQGSGLGDVMVVVTRYFGGTKLGTGGLVKAYGSTAKAVLEVLPVVEKVERIGARLVVPYELHARVRLLIGEAEAEVETEEFGAAVALRLRLRRDRAEDLDLAVRELSAGRVRLEYPA
ncbi:MAG: YigZ family protein [Candidatus Latescibacteria bacterium]|nr:YigZ family protein [Candidatus Latescibacterota bacterium]